MSREESTPGEDRSAARLEKSRRRCRLTALIPLQISGNREAEVSEEESVFKAHLLEYKT